MRLLRIAAYVLGGLIALLVLLAVGLFLVGEFRPEVFEGSPPPVATGVSFDPDHAEAGSANFETVIRRRFPPGTSEQSLRQVLIGQRFKQDPGFPPACVGHSGQTVKDGGVMMECPAEDPSRTLFYYWGGFPCSNVLIVDWSADSAARIIKAEGNYEYRCI